MNSKFYQSSQSFKIPRAQSMSNFGRFETKEEEAPEKQLRLNKQVEPKQHGDTDEPETPMSDPGSSP